MQIGALGGNAEAASTGTVPEPRLVRAAHGFEGQMMRELLKPMTDGDALAGKDGDEDAGSSGALGQFASEALGQALSRGGGFGIADRVVKDFSHSGNRHGNGKVTGKLHANTVMGSPE